MRSSHLSDMLTPFARGTEACKHAMVAARPDMLPFDVLEAVASRVEHRWVAVGACTSRALHSSGWVVLNCVLMAEGFALHRPHG